MISFSNINLDLMDPLMVFRVAPRRVLVPLLRDIAGGNHDEVADTHIPILHKIDEVNIYFRNNIIAIVYSLAYLIF